MNPKFDAKTQAWHRNRGARQTIARRLLEGPDWLVPPGILHNDGYLEPVLRIGVSPCSVNLPSYSWELFVDATVNRHRRFLKPVVRKVYWDRPQEYPVQRIMAWPLVQIHHHTLVPKEQPRMHRLLQRLDRSFCTVEFLTAGLITDRTNPPGCIPKGTLPPQRFLSVVRSNDCQYIEFGLDEYAGKNRSIERAARALIEYCDQLCRRPDHVPYRERYPVDLRNRNLGRTEWLFRPKQPTL